MGKKVELARHDSGYHGQPGQYGNECEVVIYRLRPGRYEAIGNASNGKNQGVYVGDYHYGPWRGRGDTIDDAVNSMMEVVDSDWHKMTLKAAREAAYEAEDLEEADN